MKKVFRIIMKVSTLIFSKKIIRKILISVAFVFSVSITYNIATDISQPIENYYGRVATLIVFLLAIGIDARIIKSAETREEIIKKSAVEKVKEVYEIVKNKDNRIDRLMKKNSILEEYLPPKIKEELKDKLLIQPEKKKPGLTPEGLIRKHWEA